MARQSITSELIQGMASQLHDVPASAEKAQAHAAAFDGLMAMIGGLRTLPLKEVEPAVVFAPLEGRK